MTNLTKWLKPIRNKPKTFNEPIIKDLKILHELMNSKKIIGRSWLDLPL